MKVGFITSEYPHLKVKYAAGIATSIKNLAVVLAKKGNDVTVFVYHQEVSEVLIEQGVEIHLIKKPPDKISSGFIKASKVCFTSYCFLY